MSLRLLDMPVVSLLVLTSAFALSSQPVRAETKEDHQLWLSATVSGSFSEKLVYVAQIQTRYLNDLKHNAQRIFLPPIIGYRVTDDFTLSVGYGYTALPGDGEPDGHEHRAFEEISYRFGQVGPGNLDIYVRTEQRFRSGGQEPALRIRSRVRYKLPLAKTGGKQAPINAVFAIEPMAYFNTPDWGPRRGFDQFRSYAGVELPLNGKIRLDAGYTNMIFNGGATTDINHIAVMGLVLKL